MSLSSLIVQREVATMRQVEEALARQVIYGGDLVTNLLEVVRVDEAVLTPLLAESMQLAPAPTGELPKPPEDVRALVPLEMATQRSVVPLEVAGATLLLAVAEPLPPDMQDQLTFAFGMSIEQRAAPFVRVRQAIARAYGVPLERRMQRLIARLGGRPSAAGSMPPPLGAPPAVTEPPRPPSGPPARGASLAPAPAGLPPSAVGASMPIRPTRRTTSTSFPAGRAPLPAAPPEAAATSAAARSTDSEPPSAPGTRGGLLQRDASPSVRAARRRRGPLTFDMAKLEAAEMRDRDALLDLFFDFSRQFFDYAALFLVHADIAEGRDAFGVGAPRERVLGIGVPLDLPSLLASAREKRAPLIAKAAAEGLDAVLLADLQRARDAEIGVVPLVVRTRAVAILIGDCGDSGIDRASLQQVATFSGVVGKAFERIIVRRKLEGFIAGSREGSAGRVEPSTVGSKGASLASPVPPAAVRSRPFSTGRPSGGPGTPPPPANIAAVRPISGPPIPREEPDIASPIPSSDVVTVGRSQPEVAERAVEPIVGLDPSIEEVRVEVSEDVEDAGALLDELGWEADADAVVVAPTSAISIAVPPHRPPSARTVASDELPSVIVDLDSELGEMVERVIRGEADELAESELLRQGERAMRVIMARFPGPVTFERVRIAGMTIPPRPSDCGPLLRLVARERKVALPFVLERLSHADPEVRGWATHVLCELPYAEAIPHLLPRLRDADPSTRASAGHALVASARLYPEQVHDMLVGLVHAIDARERVAALEAMKSLRQTSFVPELVRALADGDETVVAAAHEALVGVTLQDFGPDARPWLRWWDQNGGKNRIEWLIDALTHEVSEIRRAAGNELRAVSKEYFGYASDLPVRDRERAQQRYRDWWITEGRARFRRP
jgi:hypothetical protein